MKKNIIHHLDTKPSLSFLIINNNIDNKETDIKTTTSNSTKFKKVQIITVLGCDDENNDNKDKDNNNTNIKEQQDDENPTYIDQEQATTNTTTTDNEDKFCKICNKQFSLYTCPRCNIGYCSSICFKSHNGRCSSEFFEHQVRENLSLMDKVSPKDSLEFLKRMKKIYEIEDEKFDSLLSKFNLPTTTTSTKDITLNQLDKLNFNQFEGEDEDEDSNDEGEDGIDIGSLNLDKMTSDQLLSLLPANEIEEFNKSIKDGTISSIIEEWIPWWKINIDGNKNGNINMTGKIVEINEDNSNSREGEEQDEEIKQLLKRIPIIYSPMLPFSTFSKQPPSKSLYFHLIDILYSYCYLMRTFNGDWVNDNEEAGEEGQECILEGCTLILDLSSILKPPTSTSKKASPPILYNSIESVLNNLLKSSHSNEIENKNNQGNIYFSLFLLQDVIEILYNRNYILSTLSHINHSFSIANKILKSNLYSKLSTTTTTTPTISEIKKEFQELSKCYDMVCKKMVYFISWVNEENQLSFQTLSKSVNNYFENEKLIMLKK